MIALIIIATVIIIVLLIAAMGNKEMNIGQETTIKKPIAAVFEYVKLLRNHENFSVWAKMDPDMKKEYKGTDGQPGFLFSWDSQKKKNVGMGEEEIKHIVNQKSIEYELRFFKPRQDQASAELNFWPVDAQQTRVRWSFHSRMKFPGNLMKGMISKMLTRSLAEGLANLKAVLEKA
ncbi:MAG TPA: SRPBCC family protein [Puia sp.]|nr:SRPBCC family protein [Puia sp.]